MDSPLGNALFLDGDYSDQVIPEMDYSCTNEVGCDHQCNQCNVVGVVSLDIDIKEEKNDEFEDITQNRIANSEDDFKSFNLISIEKQNIDLQANKIDIEELGYKWLEVEKTEDVKDEVNVYSVLSTVSPASHGEEITVRSSYCWGEVGYDKEQKEHDVTDSIICDCVVKKEKSESEDVVIDMEKCTKGRTSNSEILKSIDVTCKDNSKVSKGMRWYCRFCQYRTKYEDSFKEHLGNKHNEGIQWYHCHDCEFKTFNIKYLKDHFKRKHDTERYKCQHCTFETTYKSYLTKHFKSKHDDNVVLYKCRFCNLQTKQRAYLIRHYKFKHDPEVKRDPDSEWRYCQHCAFKTKFRKSLEEHLEFKHGIVVEKDNILLCQFCDYKCKFKSSLRQHFTTKHSQDVDWHHCHRCEFKTVNKDFLKEHVKQKHKSYIKQKPESTCRVAR